MLTSDQILSIFRETGGLLEGHFQLTSGLHSATYFQCAKVLQYPKHAAALCGLIAGHFSGQGADAVVAPALGGIVVGQEVGRQLGVRSMFTERSEGTMQLRRGFLVIPGERILVCEDVITTGGSVSEVLDILRKAGAEIVGVGAIVDRSGGTVTFPGFFPAVSLAVTTYQPAGCPLCREGIPVVKPGSRPGQQAR